jgi:cytochrome P450 family 709
MLNKLKLVNMFLLETLRLYTPVSQINREASSGLDLGGFRVPRGAILTVPIVTIHRDKEVWGRGRRRVQAREVRERSDESSQAPENALLSFSAGARSCIGQNFAMVEAKAVIAMMLQRFSLELSPNYVHAPWDMLTLRPRDGLPVLLRAL